MTTLSIEYLKAWLELLPKVTPGPWGWNVIDASMASLGVLPDPGLSDPHVLSVSPCKSCRGDEWEWGKCLTPSEADAAHLAKCDPATIAALIEGYIAMAEALSTFMDEHDNTYDGDPLSEGMSVFISKARSALTLSPAGVTEDEVEAAARATRSHTSDVLTMTEHMDLVRAALEAAAKAQPSFKQGRRMMPGYTDFDTWFHEQEGTSLRSERFNGDVEWLKAAFDAGRSAQPSISTGQGEAVAFKFPYQHTFNAIAAAVTPNAVGLGISVAKFQEAFGPLYANYSLPAGHVAVPVERLTTVLDEYDAQTKALPLGHEDRTRGASSYNWRRSVVDDIRAMLSSLPNNQGEGK